MLMLLCYTSCLICLENVCMLSKITPAIDLFSAKKHQQIKERYSLRRYCAIPAYKRVGVTEHWHFHLEYNDIHQDSQY